MTTTTLGDIFPTATPLPARRAVRRPEAGLVILHAVFTLTVPTIATLVTSMATFMIMVIEANATDTGDPMVGAWRILAMVGAGATIASGYQLTKAWKELAAWYRTAHTILNRPSPAPIQQGAAQ